MLHTLPPHVQWRQLLVRGSGGVQEHSRISPDLKGTRLLPWLGAPSSMANSGWSSDAMSAEPVSTGG